MSWPTTLGRVYQLQWSPHAGDSGPWTDVGESATGDGSTIIRYDPVPSVDRHYRVMA